MKSGLGLMGKCCLVAAEGGLGSIWWVCGPEVTWMGLGGWCCCAMLSTAGHSPAPFPMLQQPFHTSLSTKWHSSVSIWKLTSLLAAAQNFQPSAPSPKLSGSLPHHTPRIENMPISWSSPSFLSTFSGASSPFIHSKKGGNLPASQMDTPALLTNGMDIFCSISPNWTGKPQTRKSCWQHAEIVNKSLLETECSWDSCNGGNLAKVIPFSLPIGYFQWIQL